MTPGATQPVWERSTLGDFLSLGVFLVLLAPFARHTASALAGGQALWTVAAAGVLGIAAADFITGLAHWACDTFFAEDTPVIGAAVIEPFREHHRDPLAMTRRAFLRVSNSDVVGTSVVLAGVWAWRAGRDATPSVFADAWLTSLACALFVTNQLHKWAHMADVPRWVARLQSARLILHPAHHARHHVPEGGRAFCVTTGWLNPALDGVRFFEALEALIRAVGRAGARRSASPPAQSGSPRDPQARP